MCILVLDICTFDIGGKLLHEIICKIRYFSISSETLYVICVTTNRWIGRCTLFSWRP